MSSLIAVGGGMGSKRPEEATGMYLFVDICCMRRRDRPNRHFDLDAEMF